MADELYVNQSLNDNVIPDLAGEVYFNTLRRLHDVLGPKSYLEIGVQSGMTLALARCPSIGIDPEFAIVDPAVMAEILSNPAVFFFKMASDVFFARHDPSQLFGGPVDFAFLDGLHRCEFLLRDFISTERFARKNSIVVLHDCLPTEPPMAERTPGAPPIVAERAGLWTGDVWRVARLLKKRRPDLSIAAFDSAPTGLVLITNLDPGNTSLHDNYYDCLKEMFSWDLKTIGLQSFVAEMAVESASVISSHEQITARYFL
jgi:hypothetical protein